MRCKTQTELDNLVAITLTVEDLTRKGVTNDDLLEILFLWVINLCRSNGVSSHEVSEWLAAEARKYGSRNRDAQTTQMRALRRRLAPQEAPTKKGKRFWARVARAQALLEAQAPGE